MPIVLRLGLGLLLDVLYFPLWWYGPGVVFVAQRLFQAVRVETRRLAIDVWVRNVFVPMYGQWSVSGRLMSFFMRIVQILGRGLLLCVWTFLLCCVFLAYLSLPLFCVFGLLWNSGAHIL